eukprot:TRINITY_DN8863_c0_g2_i5.p1 TRINITY_DN8863_c0_g2~~TRINITY_DN8863_c0_g2_i5.p1  ORF type:complete len:352 (-),score=65.71 TRINITY_DN8863_c0_g2_i5:236-1291(-)
MKNNFIPNRLVFLVVGLSLVIQQSLQQSFACEPSHECYELGADILTNLTLGRWTFVRFETNTTLKLQYQVELQFAAESKSDIDTSGTILDATDLNTAEANRTDLSSLDLHAALTPPACAVVKKSKGRQSPLTHIARSSASSASSVSSVSSASSASSKASKASSTSPLWQIAFVSGICVGSELGPDGECPSPKRRQSIVKSAVCKCSEQVAKWCPSWRIDHQNITSARSSHEGLATDDAAQGKDLMVDSRASDGHGVVWTHRRVAVAGEKSRLIVEGKSEAISDVLHDAPKGEWYVGIYVMRMPNTTAERVATNSTLTWKITGTEISAAYPLLSRPLLPLILMVFVAFTLMH